MVVPHQKFIEWKNQHLPTDRVLFILFHVPCWELHTLSFKMGMPLLQASLHKENFSLTKPYDWADCVHPKLAFSASHLGKWLIMESHRWLLPSSEHYSWQDTRRRKHSWLFKVDASLWWLTQALSKDFVVRSTEHMGSSPNMLTGLRSQLRCLRRGIGCRERVGVTQRATRAFPVHSLSWRLLSTSSGIWECTWLRPHPFSQWTNNFNPVN